MSLEFLFYSEVCSKIPILMERCLDSGSLSCWGKPSTPASILSIVFLLILHTRCFSPSPKQLSSQSTSCFELSSIGFAETTHYLRTHFYHASFYLFYPFYGGLLSVVEGTVLVYSFTTWVLRFLVPLIWIDFRFSHSFRWVRWCWQSYERKFVFPLTLYVNFNFLHWDVKLQQPNYVLYGFCFAISNLILRLGTTVIGIFVKFNQKNFIFPAFQFRIILIFSLNYQCGVALLPRILGFILGVLIFLPEKPICEHDHFLDDQFMYKGFIFLGFWLYFIFQGWLCNPWEGWFAPIIVLKSFDCYFMNVKIWYKI